MLQDGDFSKRTEDHLRPVMGAWGVERIPKGSWTLDIYEKRSGYQLAGRSGGWGKACRRF